MLTPRLHSNKKKSKSSMKTNRGSTDMYASFLGLEEKDNRKTNSTEDMSDSNIQQYLSPQLP